MTRQLVDQRTHLAASSSIFRGITYIKMHTHRQHLILRTLITSALVCVAFFLGCDVDGVDFSALQCLACLLELVLKVLHYNNRAITAGNNNIIVLEHLGCRFGVTEAEQGHNGYAGLAQHVVGQQIDLGRISKDCVFLAGDETHRQQRRE